MAWTRVLTLALLIGLAPALLPEPVSAQAPSLVFPELGDYDDNKWRHQLDIGTNYSSGNNDNSSISLATDSVRTSMSEKLDLYSKVQVFRAEGQTTGEVGRIGARYQREINRRGVYGFGQTEAARDTGAKIRSRYSFGNGAGLHLLRTEDNLVDLFMGLGYAQDHYLEPNEVAGVARLKYSRFEMLIGQESFHRFTSNSTFKQRLVFYQNLANGGLYRGEYDVGLSVAMNESLSITTSLSLRYNSDPGPGLNQQDVSFITALSWKTN